MRVAITGRHGQVVRALLECATETGDAVVTLARPEFDLMHPAGTEVALAAAKPDVVVSAAAYTAVDAAESDCETAFAVNAEGAGAVAAAAASLRIPVIHLSTDYVFEGTLDRPYREDDATGPQGVYGASKLAGERAVAAANDDHAILRISWVYSPFGKNFVRTMLAVAGQREELTVVADQHGTPGNAHDIARGILSVARNLVTRPDDRALRGTFHMSAAGATTWAGFAEAIFVASRRVQGPSASVRHITTAEYPTPASRPANSRMDSSKLAAVHGVSLPEWQTSLPACVERLVSGIGQGKQS